MFVVSRSRFFEIYNKRSRMETAFMYFIWVFRQALLIFTLYLKVA
ncbi:hypothetical protein HMPREF9370_1430 [Neisseria wadsworthii 9715]|uniref:Uncharacterized protein n=1 Tax=Neisseria wadsworthii 9715 TaxID=1030841 RepID=G4CQS0_9NEIS|nr:hypothetical protein HMPREF9370_1430 [Neisseria wadsworthii 9715]